jgi:peptide/nickel transport system permease protein
MVLRSLRQFFRNPSACIGLAVLLALVLACACSSHLVRWSPFDQDLGEKLLSPSRAHWMGTDQFGRDVLARVLAGTKYSLTAGFVSVLLSLAGGLALGIPAGYLGGALDKGLMLVCDIMLAFPGILMAMALSMVIGPGIYTPMVTVGISSIPVFARLVRVQFMSLREAPFVEAMRAAGAGGVRIALKHILPNAMGPILVQSTLRMGVAIVTAATLSFLGLGAQPPNPEWGTMLNDARTYFMSSAYLAMFPGLAITISVIAINLVGDALRDHLDPKLRER